MKKLFTLIALMIAALQLFAQAPELLSYQAVIRDAGGSLVTGSNVGVRISILQGGASGTPFFVETHSVTTNANGLVSFEIGNGTIVSGSFSSIDWEDGPYFLETATDPSGGSNYSVVGTTQLLSVPYALHAKSAEMSIDALNAERAEVAVTVENVEYTETDPVYESSPASQITEERITGWDAKLDMEEDGDVTNELQTISKKGLVVTLSDAGGSFTDSVNTYEAGDGIVIEGMTISMKKRLKVGDIHMGGIVFYVDPGGEHGLVASLNDLDGGEGVPWSDHLDSEIGTDAKSATDGISNTEAMLAHQHQTSAAQLCRNLGPEWYLPSNRELYLLFSREMIIDQVLDNDGDPSTNGLVQERTEPTWGWYWSSTEQDDMEAWVYKAPSGDSSKHGKHYSFRVRAVRAF